MPPKRTPAKSNQATKPTETAVTRRGTALNKADESHGAVVPFNPKGAGPGVSSRELVLWAQMHGGAELILAKSITGPEKLRIKAEALSGAVRAPINFQELLRTAESQLDDNLSQIDRLRDHRFFYDDMVEYINSRADRSQGKKKLLDNARLVSEAIATRIHNLHYLAGSWKQIVLLLKELIDLIPDFKREDLGSYFKRKDSTFRDRFVLLYRELVVLVGIYQKSLSLAAAASSHYAHYFMTIQAAWMAFRREEAMGAVKSLIDTVVMELIFPESQYPLHILFTCLHEALEAAPKEGKRFTQRMFDAIGDLGEAVRMLDMVETCLVGEWARLRDSIPPYTPAFDAYIDAEYFSIAATKIAPPLIQKYITPLTKARDKGTHQALWKVIDQAFIQCSGFPIAKTWQLEQDQKLSPQWSYIFPAQYFEDSASEFSQSEDEENIRGAVVLHQDRKKISRAKKAGFAAGVASSGPGALVKTNGGKGRKQARKITQGERGDRSGEDDSDNPPGLAYVSASTDLDEESADESSDDGLVDDDSDIESDWSDGERAELSRLFTQMMSGQGDLFSDDDDEDEPDPFGPTPPPGVQTKAKQKGEKKSKNPFVNFMKEFAGRLFSLDETLNSQQPRRPDPNAVKAEHERIVAEQHKAAAPKAPAAKPAAQPKVAQAPGLQATRDERPSDDDMPPLEPITMYIKNNKPTKPAAPKGKPTIEEVEDEDDDQKMSKNKKKRLRKKANAGTAESPARTASANASTTSLPTSPTPSASKKKTSKSSGATAVDPELAAAYQQNFSASSLSLHQPQAQSARSYLQEQGMFDVKSKQKTRAPEPTVPEVREPPTKEGFGKTISKLFKKEEPKATEQKEDKPKIHMPFSLGKKVRSAMTGLFGGEAKTMKWDVFVKAMKAMGFTYVPSTAGSSVRFDPPDPKDKPITFHKPHPDPTLQGNMLQQFRKRLERQYGWTAENFKKFDIAAVEEEVD